MSFLNGFRNVARVCQRLSSTSCVRMQQRTAETLCPVTSFSFVPSRAFSCGTGSLNKFHTQGDQELAEFLEEEINLEKEAQVHAALPRIKGFQMEIEGSEVTLSRDYDGESVQVKFNINSSVEDEAPEEEAAEGKDLKSKPRFSVDLARDGQVLTFLCSFPPSVPNNTEPNEDIFDIEEFFVHGGQGHDSPTQYIASAGIIDGDLYNMFMNMLDERGINSDLASGVIDLSTAHEHKLYIKTLQDIRKFLQS